MIACFGVDFKMETQRENSSADYGRKGKRERCANSQKIVWHEEEAFELQFSESVR